MIIFHQNIVIFLIGWIYSKEARNQIFSLIFFKNFKLIQFSCKLPKWKKSMVKTVRIMICFWKCYNKIMRIENLYALCVFLILWFSTKIHSNACILFIPLSYSTLFQTKKIFIVMLSGPSIIQIFYIQFHVTWCTYRFFIAGTQSNNNSLPFEFSNKKSL